MKANQFGSARVSCDGRPEARTGRWLQELTRLETADVRSTWGMPPPTFVNSSSELRKTLAIVSARIGRPV